MKLRGLSVGLPALKLSREGRKSPKRGLLPAGLLPPRVPGLGAEGAGQAPLQHLAAFPESQRELNPKPPDVLPAPRPPYGPLGKGTADGGGFAPQPQRTLGRARQPPFSWKCPRVGRAKAARGWGRGRRGWQRFPYMQMRLHKVLEGETKQRELREAGAQSPAPPATSQAPRGRAERGAMLRGPPPKKKQQNSPPGLLCRSCKGGARRKLPPQMPQPTRPPPPADAPREEGTIPGHRIIRGKK